MLFEHTRVSMVCTSGIPGERSSRIAARDTRDWRERREARNQGLHVAPVALFPPVSPVSLESGIGDCSRSAHELCGLDSASSQLADDSYVMRLRNTTLYQPVSYTRSTWQAAEKLFWHVRTSIVSHVAQQNNTPAGCSKRPFGKAAASEGPRRTLWGTLRV